MIDLSERRARRVPRSAGWLVAAAAAVVAVVMSVTAVASMHSRSRTAADAANYLQRGSDRRFHVRSGRAAEGQLPVPNIASVVAHPGSVAVVALNMAPNSKSTSYVLWGINGKTKNPIALGVFDVASDHVQTRQVGTDSRGYSGFTSFAVSHEPGHTPPADADDHRRRGRQVRRDGCRHWLTWTGWPTDSRACRTARDGCGNG